MEDPDSLNRDLHQAWFWTEKWQKGEHQVDEHVRQGEAEEFDTMEDFLKTLDDQ